MDDKQHNRPGLRRGTAYRSIDGVVRPVHRDRPRMRQPAQPQPQLHAQPRQVIESPKVTEAVSLTPRAPRRAERQTTKPVKSKRPWSTKRKVVTAALTILLLGFGVGTLYGAKLLGSVNKAFHGNVFTDARALLSTKKLKGEDQGRVNILLAGDSADDPGHGGADLTDSIMVVSIDTKNHTGFMLSIPRDLWVAVPTLGHQKINAANDVTTFSQAGYPNGGMGQLEQIVQTDLGIPIDYYALINYTAFKNAVTAVGGITVNIQSTDPRGLFDPNISRQDGGPLKLPNGTVTLDGQTALNLARARGDPCDCARSEYGFPQSDYNRTQHQRQMLTALAQKATTIGVITNPMKVSQLFSSFGNNIATDLGIQDVSRFVQVTKGMNLSNLQTLSLTNSGPNALLMSYLAPNGQDALIPKAGVDNFGQIQQYYQQLTSNNPVAKESPSVIVLNGSNTVGLARKEATLLQSKGFNVVSVADANGQYPSTMIVDNTKGQKPASKQLLQQILSGSTTTTTMTGSTEAGEAQNYTADFVVIAGQDRATAQ